MRKSTLWLVCHHLSDFFNVQFYKKCAVLKAPCAILIGDLCSLHYIPIKHGYSTCMISAPSCQVYVACVYENQGLFLNMVEARKMCNQ